MQTVYYSKRYVNMNDNKEPDKDKDKDQEQNKKFWEFVSDQKRWREIQDKFFLRKRKEKCPD